MLDISLWAVVVGIIGARFYHVLTHPDDYFGPGKNVWNPFEPGSIWAIWEGGGAIFGSLIGGAIGVYIGCRFAGLRFWSVADAIAPGLLVAQALGRLGNWFNQELFGLPTDLPWGLEIDRPNAGDPDRHRRRRAVPPDVPLRDDLEPGRVRAHHPDHQPHPLQPLREVAGEHLADLAALHRDATSGSGARCSACTSSGTALGRAWFESIRLDPSETFLGIRSNVWAALARDRARARHHRRADPASPRGRAECLPPGSRVEARRCGRLRRHLLGYRRCPAMTPRTLRSHHDRGDCQKQLGPTPRCIPPFLGPLTSHPSTIVRTVAMAHPTSSLRTVRHSACSARRRVSTTRAGRRTPAAWPWSRPCAARPATTS